MRQTYIIDIVDLNTTWAKFEKSKKYEIRKCKKEVSISEDLDEFNRLHLISRPDRSIDFKFIKKVYQDHLPNCRIYATDTAMAMISWDNKMGYYLLAGWDKTKDGSPSKILWVAMKDLNKMGIKQLNLCGANKENMIMFKKGFGGVLTLQENPCLVY